VPRPRRFDAVLFDLDGTLADTSRDLATAINEMLRGFGLEPISLSAVLDHVGHGVRSLVESCLLDERGARPADVGGLDRAVAEFRGCYSNHLLDTTRPYPGMIAICDRLAGEGIALGIVTNKVEDLSRRIVEGLGMAGRFRVLIGGDSLATQKPDPAPLLRALQTMGVEAGRAAMVGDSEIDVEAARRAGIRVAAVTWGFCPAETLKRAAPDRLVDDPAQLEEWLLGGASE
jgi:phosphoglycolate phosphatase